MSRTKISYSQEELERPVNFIIVIADRLLDVSLIDYDEATSYVSAHKRRALIVSDSSVFSEIMPSVNLEVIMNATSPAVRIVDTMNKPYNYVYERVLKLFKNGLLICDKNTLTNDIAESIALTRGIGLDIVLHRDNLIQISKEEMKRVNFVRFHYNKLTSFSSEFISVLASHYGSDQAFGLLLAQYIVNVQHDIFDQYFNNESKRYVLMGFTNFVNNLEHDRQAAYYVYYDLVNNKIIGVQQKNFSRYVIQFMDTLSISYSEDEIERLTQFYYATS